MKGIEPESLQGQPGEPGLIERREARVIQGGNLIAKSVTQRHILLHWMFHLSIVLTVTCNR